MHNVRVQLRLPLRAERRASSAERSLVVGGQAYAILIARHRWARRYVLRLVDASTLRLTVPRGASIAGGLKFAEHQSAWVARELGRRREQASPWRHGHILWFCGERVAIDISGGAIRAGSATIPLLPDADLRRSIEEHCFALATTELPVRCLELAAQHCLKVARVSIRDQRSRWGACSPRGVITLNWRLVQMPRHVSDYILLHELMHLRQPNHSRRFWREVASVYPAWKDAEGWLRRNGREIL